MQPHQKKNLKDSWICNKCSAETTLNRKRKYKQDLVNLFGGKCTVCDYSRSIEALEFHHPDPEQKEFQISKIYKWDKMVEEAKKCILLCNRCHREIHHKDINLL